jgi:hypothetical protein
MDSGIPSYYDYKAWSHELNCEKKQQQHPLKIRKKEANWKKEAVSRSSLG